MQSPWEIPAVNAGQFLGMFLAVERDIALDPIHISLLRADGAVLAAANVAILVEQFRLAGGRSAPYRAFPEAVAQQTGRPNASRNRRLLLVL
jgi:hypothetical protein